MEILLWLVPSVVVTALAMVWVSWLGRQSRREIDRDRAVRLLGEALSDERVARRPGAYVAPEPPLDRSSGVAVRPSRLNPPDDESGQERRAG